MGKSVKSSGAVSMIRGNDGPTSIFIGGKGKKKQYEKMYHDVYRYYGVSMEDIANKTKRYEDVVRGMMSF